MVGRFFPWNAAMAGSSTTMGFCAFIHPRGNFCKPETHLILWYLFSKMSVGFSGYFHVCVLKCFHIKQDWICTLSC